MARPAIIKTIGLLRLAIRQTKLGIWQIVSPAALAAAASLFEGLSLALLLPGIQLVLSSSGAQVPGGYNIPSWLADYMPTSQRRLLAVIILMVLLAALLKVTLSYFSSLFTSYQVKQFAHRLRSLLYERYLSFGKLFFDRNSLGHQQQILTTYVSVISLSLTSFQMTLYAVCTTAVYFIIMMLISVPMTLLVTLIFPVLYLSSKGLIDRIVKSSDAYTQAYNELGKKIVNALSAVPLIKAYCFEDPERGNFSYHSSQVAAYEYSIEKKNLLVGPLQEFILVIFLVIFAALIGFMEKFGTGGTVAEYVVFLLILKRAATLFGVFNTLLSSVATISGPFEELMSIFNDQDKFFVEDGRLSFNGLKSEIEFKDLNYTFPKGKQAIFNLSCTITKGTVTGIVGTSGAGKSTLINLLMRFYDPPPNSLFVDGIDIRDLNLESWRSKLALVSQDAYLFHGSLRDNLVYGLRREVSDSELESVLRLAQLDTLVSSLPDGLLAQVGERGLQLSGGQRQRVSIARAILKKAEILLLDEAVSALDSITEREVQRAIENLVEDKTAIVITHRLSSVVHADQILVLENGSIVEQGQLQQLYKSEGRFTEYCREQGFNPTL